MSLLPQESGDEVESKEHYESQIGWHYRYLVYETIPVSNGNLLLRLKNQLILKRRRDGKAEPGAEKVKTKTNKKEELSDGII